MLNIKSQSTIITLSIYVSNMKTPNRMHCILILKIQVHRDKWIELKESTVKNGFLTHKKKNPFALLFQSACIYT